MSLIGRLQPIRVFCRSYWLVFWLSFRGYYWPRILRAMRLSVTINARVAWWSFVGLVGIAGGGALVLVTVQEGALIFAPTNRVGYFLKYSTLVGASKGGGAEGFVWKVPTYEQVEVMPQPHDCEWGSAPLGNKHCRYEAEVNSVWVANYYISDDGIIPVVSHDRGKTWDILQRGETPTPGISVFWTKVDE